MRCVTAWLLDPDVLHLNHGSFGATPGVVLEAQQRLRQRLEANPTRFFLGGEYQALLDEARGAVASFVGADEAGLVFVPNATAGVKRRAALAGADAGAGRRDLGDRPRVQRLRQRGGGCLRLAGARWSPRRRRRSRWRTNAR